MTYTEAATELEDILSELREGGVNIDELSEKVKRAEMLIQWCRERLRSVEGQLNGLEDNAEG